MMNPSLLAVSKSEGKGRKKKGNRHATNTRRRERKHAHNIRRGYTPQAGKCGSSFCSARTGCEPWKEFSH